MRKREREVYIEIERKHHSIYCPVPSSLFRPSMRAGIRRKLTMRRDRKRMRIKM